MSLAQILKCKEYDSVPMWFKWKWHWNIAIREDSMLNELKIVVLVHG